MEEMIRSLIEEFRTKLHAIHTDLEAVYRLEEENKEMLKCLLEKSGSTFNIS